MNRILFHKYEMLRRVGTGRAGTVYLAKDLHLNRLVAVKESTEELLTAEIELLKELDHPGLPRIYDCFSQQERTFLVMEYIEGMTLRQYLDKHGRVPERQAVKWAVELSRILGYLHSRHPAVIYRDLKPENIMIRQDGKLKLIDLGGTIRYTCGSKKEELCVGTPGYAPSEQWKEARGDKRWDIYGLGIVLHEMLTGVNPTGQPYKRRTIEEYDKALQGALDEIIRRCIAEKTGERYQSMEQVESALLRYPVKRRRCLIGQRIKKTLLALMGGCTIACFTCPLLEGIPENQIPFPYLLRPLTLLILTFLLFLLFFKIKRKKQFLRRQEKNVWLTEKKFSGLFFLFLAAVVLATGIRNEGVFLPVVYAEEEDKDLWVEMRDEFGRKMLLRNDAVYITDKAVRFELPADRLPTKELSMQIVAVDEDGMRYSSRIFCIMAADKESAADGSLN